MLATEMLQTGSATDTAGRTRRSYVALRPTGRLAYSAAVGVAILAGLSRPPAGNHRWNAVLLKHPVQRSSMCVAAGDACPPRWFVRGTLSALLMEEGLVEATLHDECVPAVTVIGTESVGRALAAQTGWLLKRSSLHVVGNGATVVMPSADLNVALAAAIEALTSGTEAGKRLILHAEYLQRLCSPAGQGSRSFATWRPDEAGD